MPKMYGFEDTEPMKARDVCETQQLEPRTGKAQFESSNNKLERYTKAHGPLGMLGDRAIATGGKK